MTVFVSSHFQVCVYLHESSGSVASSLPCTELESICRELLEDGTQAAGIQYAGTTSSWNQLSKSPLTYPPPSCSGVVSSREWVQILVVTLVPLIKALNHSNNDCLLRGCSCFSPRSRWQQVPGDSWFGLTAQISYMLMLPSPWSSRPGPCEVRQSLLQRK